VAAFMVLLGHSSSVVRFSGRPDPHFSTGPLFALHERPHDRRQAGIGLSLGDIALGFDRDGVDAARLAAVLAGESPANRRVQSLL
jgi:hypothetical protein